MGSGLGSCLLGEEVTFDDEKGTKQDLPPRFLFTDAYEGSAAAKVDEKFNNLADCPDSTLWEGLKVQ